MKEEFNNNEKNSFKMRLTNKTKITKNALKNMINIIKTSFKEIKCRKFCICETKYD